MSINELRSCSGNEHFMLILCQVVKMNNAQNLFKQKDTFDFNHRTEILKNFFFEKKKKKNHFIVYTVEMDTSCQFCAKWLR